MNLLQFTGTGGNSTERLCRVPLFEIGKYDTFFQGECSEDITPGFDLYGATVLGKSGANYPRDRYATCLSMEHSTAFRVVTSSYTDEVVVPKQPKSLIKRFQDLIPFRSSLEENTSEQKKTFERILCQLQIVANNTVVYCSPSVLPRYIDEELQEDLLITPDYSNIDPNIITTPDLFGIKIFKGSKLSVQKGGEIGNVRIVVISGRIIVNCNPNLEFLCCINPIEGNFFSDDDEFFKLSAEG